jgi:CheY-like chemotaxis protein
MNHKLLLADDDPDIREVVPLVLEPYGFQIVVAGNGGEGLQLAREQRDIELIMVDLMMPFVSGVEMISRLKADPALRKIPVVILSGDNSAKETALSLGAAACLRKPVELSILVSTLERIIRHTRS